MSGTKPPFVVRCEGADADATLGAIRRRLLGLDARARLEAGPPDAAAVARVGVRGDDDAPRWVASLPASADAVVAFLERWGFVGRTTARR